jgi:hypothetical protein
LSDEVVRKDHDYWRSRVGRMIGDWLTDETSVQAVAEFVEKVYVRHDLEGFGGDPRFVQSAYSQKLFSKERSSIAGVYAWRAERSASAADKARMAREADFAFRQAFAICPRSPEAVFRYVQLLTSQNRLVEALLIAEAAMHVDGQNAQIRDLAKQLRAMPGN